MMRCLKNPWYLVLINGTSKAFFGAFSGLRQGDPLSPFLFSLVVNAPSALINHVVNANLIK